jgi:hypothetical protein
MILPSTILIQIIDNTGKPNPLENVLFGLKIFSSDTEYYNYSVFKSNALGQVTLTRQDIIDNTELKHESNITSATPTRIELYIWEGEITDIMIRGTQLLLERLKDSDFIAKDLKNHGVADKEIPRAVEAAQKGAGKDRAFYEYIKDAINNSIEPQPTKINDIWNDTLPKSYQFIIQ